MMGAVIKWLATSQARATCAGETPRPAATLATLPVVDRVEGHADVGGLRPGALRVPGPGQPPASQRAPWDDADALVRAERQHLALLLPVQQVVVVLHAGGTGPPVPLRRIKRLGKLPCVHGRCAD